MLNWRDPEHPRAGGAEFLTMLWAAAWRDAGAEVTLLANRFRDSAPETEINGVRVVRRGTPATQAWHAWRFYRNAGPFDAVIEEINTLPFLSPIWGRSRSILLMHQLAREVWFYEGPRVVSRLGYLAEPSYLKLYRRHPALVLSRSTKDDLVGLGFPAERVHIIPPGVDSAPSRAATKREDTFTVAYVGRLNPSKRVDHIIDAFVIFANRMADRGREVQLKLIGEGPGAYVEKLRIRSGARAGKSIRFCGRVSDAERTDALARADALILASVREGWGLVVTEANAVGTPAIAYDVPGLRDSIQHDVTGLLCSSSRPDALASGLERLASDPKLHRRLSEAAAADARQRDLNSSSEAAVRQLTLAYAQLTASHA